jgi:hypothetical protein
MLMVVGLTPHKEVAATAVVTAVGRRQQQTMPTTPTTLVATERTLKKWGRILKQP